MNGIYDEKEPTEPRCNLYIEGIRSTKNLW